MSQICGTKKIPKWSKKRHLGKITGTFSLTVPPFATSSARVDGDVEASGGESGNV
jgi:hypothetical protein